jgi:hypothetical protein
MAPTSTPRKYIKEEEESRSIKHMLIFVAVVNFKDALVFKRKKVKFLVSEMA